MKYLDGSSMTAGYGNTMILNNCSIAVDQKEIAVIVGPNGAGKSTAMKAIFGMLPLSGGSVTLGGEDISALSPQQRVAKGMAFVPQTNNVFPSMTVDENLDMVLFCALMILKRPASRSIPCFPFSKKNASRQLANSQEVSDSKSLLPVH